MAPHPCPLAERPLSTADSITQALQTALQHHQTGRLPQAEAGYRMVLALDPGHADALHLLGVLAAQAGRPDQAVDLIRRAIASHPAFPEAYGNLGNALKDLGKRDEAIAAYRQALALRPSYATVYRHLGDVLKDNQQLPEALAAYRQAVALAPGSAESHCNLGVALYESGDVVGAMAAYRQAIALRPNFAEALANLGTALQDAGQPDQAITAYRQAIALSPRTSSTYCNLGNALRDRKLLPEAIAAYRQSVALQPDLADAHWNLALALLMTGDLAQGWSEFEWRWRWRDFPTKPRQVAAPLWDGGDLGGKTILIHAEQGAGDTLQFIRYLPRVMQRGGRVILEVPPALPRLMAHSLSGVTIVEQGQHVPAFDVHCPLLSLPRRFSTTWGTIPHEVPYLRVHPDNAAHWQSRLQALPAGPKVGLVWAGNPAFRGDKARSPRRLALYQPLAEVPNVQFVSLQKGDAAAQTRDPASGMALTDWTGDLGDFADTAALVAHLDLVICSDTAVAHLAGALGKPVWVLLPFVADWRWLLDRADSPWYPTMRLFRQQQAGDWTTLLQSVREHLAAWAGAQGSPGT